MFGLLETADTQSGTVGYKRSKPSCGGRRTAFRGQVAARLIQWSESTMSFPRLDGVFALRLHIASPTILHGQPGTCNFHYRLLYMASASIRYCNRAFGERAIRRHLRFDGISSRFKAIKAFYTNPNLQTLQSNSTATWHDSTSAMQGHFGWCLQVKLLP